MKKSKEKWIPPKEEKENKMRDKRKELGWLNELIKAMRESLKDGYQFWPRKADVDKLKEIYRHLIQQRPKIDDEPGGLKPGEYMHEWIEKDAVNFDLPTEEIIEALCRDNRLLKKKLDQKPEIDDMKKYVEKKASEIHFYIGLKEGISLDICEELVSQIIGDARGGKR